MAVVETDIDSLMEKMAVLPLRFAVREGLMPNELFRLHQFEGTNAEGIKIDYCGRKVKTGGMDIFAGSVRKQGEQVYPVVYIISDKGAMLRVEVKIDVERQVVGHLYVNMPSENRSMKYKFENPKAMEKLLDFIRSHLLSGSFEKSLVEKHWNWDQVELLLTASLR